MESEAYVSPVLAVAALGVVLVGLLSLIAVQAPGADGFRRLIAGHVQALMFAVAGVAMAASLYYSDVVGFIPCEFCWYQRIAMYPLAVLLGIAVFSGRRLDARFLVPLAAIGLALSIYHYQMQLFPESHAGECSGVVSCTDKNVNQFGFVTIPFMAGSGFLGVLLLQVAAWRLAFLERLWGGGEGEG